MARKNLDTRILTVQEVGSDFGWKPVHVMFDEKFPYRTLVEVGITYGSEDYDRWFALRRQLEDGVGTNAIRGVVDPQLFAKALARLTH